MTMPFDPSYAADRYYEEQAAAAERQMELESRGLTAGELVEFLSQFDPRHTVHIAWSPHRTVPVIGADVDPFAEGDEPVLILLPRRPA